MGGETKPDKPADDGAEESATEARLEKIEQGLQLLTEQLAKGSVEQACRALCEAAHVEPSPILMEALAALPNEAKRKAFLETQPKRAAKGQSPRSGQPLGEHKQPLPLPKNAKEFLESIRG